MRTPVIRKPNSQVRIFGLFRLVACILAIGLAGALPAAGASDPEPPLVDFTRVFPDATQMDRFFGTPPSARVARRGNPDGYLLSTRDVIGSVGYSGKPIDIIVGIDHEGRIAGAYLRSHSEPILVIGVEEASLADFVSGFEGYDLGKRGWLDTTGSPARGPDVIAGASVSSAVIQDAIIRASTLVAQQRGLLGAAPDARRVERSRFTTSTWADLAANGSIQSARFTRGDLAGIPVPAGASASDLFLELHAALLTPPTIGQNLIGKREFNRLFAGMGSDDNALLLAANGAYSFKGTRYVRTGAFDRIQLVQGDRTIGFRREGHQGLETLPLADAPELREIAIFALPATTGLDPTAPFRLEVFVERDAGTGAAVRLPLTLTYTLPDRYIVGEAPAPGSADYPGGRGASIADLLRDETGGDALWVRIWQSRWPAIAGLSTMLVVLTGILVFQDWLVRSWQRYRALRFAFLTVTIVWLGWIAGGQLSVVNVLTFVHAVMTDFSWSLFLLDPLIFILWSYVAVAMLFWGRGVYCGWLCPFGALQELTNELARRLRVPQITVPFILHERLWPIKYVLFLGLFAVSLHSTNLAVVGAEVEPFKTAISLKFMRAWPFVVYAVALLAAGLFIERFFCRYLCPLGAALAIPARLHMFEWLKRKHQCGRECNICAVRCTVQAIHPTGEINPNECIHCLNCQALYYDDSTCPPLIARRKRREQRAAARLARPAEPGTAQ